MATAPPGSRNIAPGASYEAPGELHTFMTGFAERATLKLSVKPHG